MFEDILNQINSNPEALGQVIGAIIGVFGLFIGTFITIFTTFLIRRQDLRRENRREDMMVRKDKKEKEFNLKQNVYSEFLSELGFLEKFITKTTDGEEDLKDMKNFDAAWNRIEIKVDLVSSPIVHDLKEKLQDELMSLAEKRFKGKPLALNAAYLENRQKLLDAIKTDIGIFES